MMHVTYEYYNCYNFPGPPTKCPWYPEVYYQNFQRYGQFRVHAATTGKARRPTVEKIWRQEHTRHIDGRGPKSLSRWDVSSAENARLGRLINHHNRSDVMTRTVSEEYRVQKNKVVTNWVFTPPMLLIRS